MTSKNLDLSNKNHELEVAQRSLQLTIDNLNVRIEHLEHERDHYRDDLASEHKRCSELEDQIKALQAELDEKKVLYIKIEKKLQITITKVKALQGQYDALDK